MIPFELLITSASRPHLLARTLASLWAMLPQKPARVLIHNDEVFAGRERAMADLIEAFGQRTTIKYLSTNPPRRLGPALAWLLYQAQTEYILYSQDDFEALRPLPVVPALDLMAAHDLNQIRFNKRVTMDKKGAFVKVEKTYDGLTLCVSDHWYFQTGLWRTSVIRRVADWWCFDGPGVFAEHSEAKINAALNGEMVAHGYPGLIDPARWNDPEERARTVKTFIWGKVGEEPYIRHIGEKEEDWALQRRRDN